MKDLLLGNHKYWKTSSSNLEIFIGQITYLHLTYFFLKGFTLCLCLEHTVYCLILPNSCLFVNILQVRYLKKKQTFFDLGQADLFWGCAMGPSSTVPSGQQSQRLRDVFTRLVWALLFWGRLPQVHFSCISGCQALPLVGKLGPGTINYGTRALGASAGLLVRP